MNQSYFVSGIGTEIGKTVISAILVKALKADYWKPVQCGDLDHTDSHKVKAWADHPDLTIHPERHALQLPASPHLAAARENVDIQLSDFALPKTDKPLIVEGAGGLLVPLNQQDTITDLIVHLGLPVVLVSRNYLGSINHTLLSLELLKQRGIPIHGIIFNGEPNESTESIIETMTAVRVLGRIRNMEAIDLANIERCSEQIDVELFL